MEGLYTVLCYFAGIMTGVIIMAVEHGRTRQAVEEERKRNSERIKALRTENQSLREERDAYERSNECAGAYRRGKESGKITDVDEDAYKFAKTFNGHSAKFVDRTKEG